MAKIATIYCKILKLRKIVQKPIVRSHLLYTIQVILFIIFDYFSVTVHWIVSIVRDDAPNMVKSCRLLEIERLV